MEVLKEKRGQFAEFVKLIVHHVVRFIREKIVHWIAERGGWVSQRGIIVTIWF
jgi:hypothetical protein